MSDPICGHLSLLTSTKNFLYDHHPWFDIVLRGLGRPNSHLLISPANLQGPQGSRKLDANLSKLAFTCECIFSAHFIGFWPILLCLMTHMEVKSCITISYVSHCQRVETSHIILRV